MTHSPTLHLICGQAGAGKTTYAKQLEVKDKLIRFSKDQWMVTLYGRELTLDDWSVFEPRCYEVIERITESLLHLGVSVVWDFGFWYRHERIKAAGFAKACGANCINHYLATPTEIRKMRVTQRNDSLKNDPLQRDSVSISNEAFDQQIGWFEPPTDDEGLQVLVIKPESTT
jgi:predicted kinase